MLKLKYGDDKMGRPKGTKNIMRTTEEKEQIVKEYLNSDVSITKLAMKYETDRHVIRGWINQYEKLGKEGLVSQTGRKRGVEKRRPQKPTSLEEELKQKIMKLEIENARLKKGYQVKGVGQTREYDTTFAENMK